MKGIKRSEIIRQVIIEGRSYLIDAGEGLIIEEKDKECSHRLNDLHYDGEFFPLIYNKHSGKIEDTYFANNVGLPSGMLRVKIPVGVAFGQLYSYEQPDKFNEASVMGKWNVSFLGEAYQKRLEGRKPEILLGSDIYSVDCHLNELILNDGRSRIDLSQFRQETINGKGFYTGLYDQDNERILTDKIIKQDSRHGIFHVKFPELKVLDPVGMALKEGKEAYAYLHENPFFHMQRAEVTTVRNLLLKQSAGVNKNADVSNTKKKYGMKK